MRYCISNIAWHPHEDNKIFDLMLSKGVTELEIAPGKYVSLLELESDKALAFKRKVNALGINIASLQSILFNTKGLFLFQDEGARVLLLNHMKRILDYANIFGAHNIVFGSPTNRLIGNQDYKLCESIALKFFNELGDYAKQQGTILSIEPNAKDYGGDFLTTTSETLAFLKKLQHSNIRLNFDLSTASLNSENIESTIEESFKYINHVHISEENLIAVPGSNLSKHQIVNNTLRNLNYNDCISIEMKTNHEKNNFEYVKTALIFLTKTYQ